MIVSLPWYDFAETSTFLDNLWMSLRGKLDHGQQNKIPSVLDRTTKQIASLLSNNLFLTQTCGYDIAYGTPGPLSVIVTPIFEAEGASEGYYSSFLVSKTESKINNLSAAVAFGRFAANDDRSFSGYHCVRELSTSVQPLWSGSHIESLNMIKNESADWAAIDAVTWSLLKKHSPEKIEDMQIFGQTRRVIAPPLVTAACVPKEEIIMLRRAVNSLNEDAVAKEHLQSMLIYGFREFSKEHYQESIIRKE